jgi:hypothetical protein
MQQRPFFAAWKLYFPQAAICFVPKCIHNAANPTYAMSVPAL